MTTINPVAEATQVTFGDLTKNQQQKFAYLKGIYADDDTVLNVVQLIDPKGENSWKRITDKIDALARADYNQQQYHDALYEAFDIGELYSSTEIISTVGQVRRDSALPAYISSLKKNCESDFFQLFIVETHTTEICCEEDGPGVGKMKKVIQGLKPVCKLKPNE